MFKILPHSLIHLHIWYHSALESRGQEHNCVNDFNYLLPKDIISKLSDATTQHLVNTDNALIKETVENYEFIATKILISQFIIATTQAFESMKGASKL